MGTSAAQESDLWKQIDDAEWLDCPSCYADSHYSVVFHFVLWFTCSSCLLMSHAIASMNCDGPFSSQASKL
jgi:hypothetical protein